MPIHDWTRVSAGTFHDFHTAWIVELRRSLNAGLLPNGYYALAEKVVPDVRRFGDLTHDTVDLMSEAEQKTFGGHRCCDGSAGSR